MPQRDHSNDPRTLGPFLNQDEWFFLETLKDLEQRLAADNEYNSIRAAGLLRQLLLDRVPLIVGANRETKIKLRFGVSEQHISSEEERPFLAWMPLRLTSTMEEVNREGLLSRVILMFHQYDFTVKDVIRTVANLHGGVHIDKPRNELEAAINGLNDFFTMRRSGSVVAAVKGIGEIVLDGSKALVEAINNRTLVRLIPIPGKEGIFDMVDFAGKKLNNSQILRGDNRT